ncbi:hypothetical protein CUMW_035020 [Citrus unshiu]|nr:hypothetical protein CUMW_035020 [Citrus unshiu]
MKSVKGQVLSTTPISISKAAKILSKFVYADTSASQAVCAYLRRASASFNELNQLHKELKSHRKHKITKSKIVTEDGEPTQSFISNRSDGEESERKNHKKKKKKKKEQRGWVGDTVEKEGETVEDKVRIKIEESDLGVETGKSKHEKKRGEVGILKEVKSKVKLEKDGNVGIEDDDRKKHKKSKGQNVGKIGCLEEQKNRIKIEKDGDMGMENVRKKHKKKRETSGYEVGEMKENGGGIIVEEEEGKKKKKKKRKSEEIEEGREMNLEEFQSKKKKKRKIEGEI